LHAPEVVSVLSSAIDGLTVALKRRMVDIVMLIGLPMILPARVTRCWTDDSMNPIPEEVKRRERECDGRKDRREVVPASIRTRVRV
jgi:hypothetical protein